MCFKTVITDQRGQYILVGMLGLPKSTRLVGGLLLEEDGGLSYPPPPDIGFNGVVGFGVG